MAVDIVYALAACQQIVSINKLSSLVSPKGETLPAVSLSVVSERGGGDSLMPLWLRRVGTPEHLELLRHEIISKVNSMFDTVKEKMEEQDGPHE